MSNRAYEDPYLRSLIHKLETDYCRKFYTNSSQLMLNEKEILHLLRFSDILCRAEESMHRNLSLKIISLLLELEDVSTSEYFRIIAVNTLVKLGNFPSLPIIDSDGKYLKVDEIRNDSILKDRFVDSGKNYVSLLKKTRNSLKVAPEILATSIDINIANQNKIAISDAPNLPTSTKREDCLEVLTILYEQYKWDETESGGRNPMIRHKNQLKYYATLMESWINTKPLKVLIQRTIDYFYNNGDERNLYIRQEGKLNPVKFDKENESHINKLINDVVSDIENILRFKIKNYVSNYQALLKSKNKVDLGSVDWESYIEYGTTDNKTIEIQNLGFPRNIAIFLRNKYLEAFKEDETGALCDVNELYLKNNIDKSKYKFEYDEISVLMNWGAIDE